MKIGDSVLAGHMCFLIVEAKDCENCFNKNACNFIPAFKKQKQKYCSGKNREDGKDINFILTHRTECGECSDYAEFDNGMLLCSVCGTYLKNGG